MKKAKEDWIEPQCTKTEDCLNNNNSRRAFQVVKDLTKPWQARVTTIQDRDGNCLTEEKEISHRWTEYYKELYSHQTQGVPGVLQRQESTNDDDFPILWEVEEATKALKTGKEAGFDLQSWYSRVEGQWQTFFIISTTRSVRQGNGQHPGRSLSSSHYPRKTIYSYAKITVWSA